MTTEYTDQTVEQVRAEQEQWKQAFHMGRCKVCHTDGRVHKRQGKCGLCMVKPLYPKDGTLTRRGAQ